MKSLQDALTKLGNRGAFDDYFAKQMVRFHHSSFDLALVVLDLDDFKGINDKSFDGRGNYAMGLKEHIVFPEIEFDKVDEVWGMDVIICTTANTDAEAKSLLKHLNMPFNS